MIQKLVRSLRGGEYLFLVSYRLRTTFKFLFTDYLLNWGLLVMCVFVSYHSSNMYPTSLVPFLVKLSSFRSVQRFVLGTFRLRWLSFPKLSYLMRVDKRWCDSPSELIELARRRAWGWPGRVLPWIWGPFLFFNSCACNNKKVKEWTEHLNSERQRKRRITVRCFYFLGRWKFCSTSIIIRFIFVPKNPSQITSEFTLSFAFCRIYRAREDHGFC